MSVLRDLPNNVVQGGVFSTLGGKSVLRLVYKAFSFIHKGIVSGFKFLSRIPYFLFADDGVLPADSVEDARRVASKFFQCARS